MQVLRSDRNLGATAATFEGHGYTSSATVAGVGALYYQFGRPVPFAGKLGTPTVEAGTQTFAYAVQNPLTFISGSNWSSQDTGTSYMWHDKNVEKDTDEKSIFDPSPIGWRLPIQGTWSNFTLETFPVSSSGRQHSDDHSAYYPYSGYRNNTNSSLAYIGSDGYCWSSSPSSVANGSYLTFGSSSVNPSRSYSRAIGLALRAVREN